MSFFHVNPGQPFKGPHQGQPVKTMGTSLEEASSAVLLVHGRGATAENMLQLTREFKRDDLHYRAIQAKYNTWYPNSFLAPTEQNEPGLSSGLQFIYDEIQKLKKTGMNKDHIFLIGFSQGACLTTEFVAHHPAKYGGVAGLSGGLIGEEVKPELYSGSLEGTSIFLGCSDNDPHIPRSRLEETKEVFLQLGASVTQKIYHGLGHTVNEDEIQFVRAMLEI